MSEIFVYSDEQKQTHESQTDQQTDVEIINGMACPIDPQERLECESCQ